MITILAIIGASVLIGTGMKVHQENEQLRRENYNMKRKKKLKKGHWVPKYENRLYNN